MLSDRQQQCLSVLEARLARARLYKSQLTRRETRFPWLRLAAVLLALLGSYLAFALLPNPLAYPITILLVTIFLLITIAHRRILAAIAQMQAFEDLLDAQVGRAVIDWQRIPAYYPIDVSPQHPFDRDLLVTGPNSLHHLIDMAASTGGSRRLADWLLSNQPDPQTLTLRQQAAHEMLQRPALRARLMLTSELVRAEAAPRGASDHHPRWDSDVLLQWITQQDTSAARLRPVLIALGVLAAANIALFIAYLSGVLPPWWIATFLIYFGLQSSRSREAAGVFEEAYGLALGLGLFRRVLIHLEVHPPQPDSALALLTAPFWQDQQHPSDVLRSVSRIASAASLRANPLLALLLNILVPWDLFFAYLLERVKQELRGLLPRWIDAFYELEATHSLANFAALSPDANLPTWLPQQDDQAVLVAHKLTHPLLSPETRVANAYSLPRLGQVDLITGSNMSGKSTFLRTVGANLCLAYAGSVVCAAELRVQPMRLYTSMNVADSLTDGISFFYAEVRRLKTLLDQLAATDPLPLFFLIDEIFRGTNNRERRVGSEAYLRALAGAHGGGLISTHDLELVHIADEISLVCNYHFREDIVDDKMVFDYLLRAGPSPTTNALRIMALAGLPVTVPAS